MDRLEYPMRMRTLNLYLLAMFLTMTMIAMIGCSVIYPVDPIWREGNTDPSWLCGTWTTDAVGVLSNSGNFTTTEATLQLEIHVVGYRPGSFEPVGDDDDSAATEWVENGRFVGVATFGNGCFIHTINEETDYYCSGEDYFNDLSEEGYPSFFLMEGAVTYDDEDVTYTFINAWSNQYNVTNGHVDFDPETEEVNFLSWYFDIGVNPLGEDTNLQVDWETQEFYFTSFFDQGGADIFEAISAHATIDSYSNVDGVFDVCEIPSGP